MWALLCGLAAWLTPPAPRGVSGCGRGGMCRHQSDCPRANCPGHPVNNIGEEGTPCTWRTCWGLYLFAIGCGLVWLAGLAWVAWRFFPTNGS